MTETQNLLHSLNEPQQAAVKYMDGPQLVIAGAGSGKTRVLTYKIAYLLQGGMNPWQIMALTFTNKAANEMKERIGQLVGYDKAKRLVMGTFHSVFSRILRSEATLLGLTSSFTIYDESDSRSLIKALIKEQGLSDKDYKPATVHHHISMAKNKLVFPDQYANTHTWLLRDKEANMPQIYHLYQLYCQRCRQSNAVDFDDLLVLTYQLFLQHPDVKQRYAAYFQYILVDEYQDTNVVQQRIITQLTEEEPHICVVGDDAQSIYAFRGADIDNILDFQNIYPTAQMFKLEQNYRSTQNIVQAANSLIKHNIRQIPKNVFSEKDEGEHIRFKPTYSDKEEAAVVCNDIKRLIHNEQLDYGDFAILYRTNSQSRTFEEEMRKRNIPYRIYGGLSFYQRKEIKDVIAYFRLMVNPHDEEAFKRIINYPARGIGNTTITKISDCAYQNGVSLWQVIEQPESYNLSLSKSTLAKISAFRDMMKQWSLKADNTDAYTLGLEIVKGSGIHADLYADKEPESISRQENVQELLNSLQEFVDLVQEEDTARKPFIADFLQEVALLTDKDSDDDHTSKVLMMTIHAAKGLEFPAVYVVGLEENIFPSPNACNSPRELEEERRLLYVAITRAEKHCILTSAKTRYRFGRMSFNTPSRFLKDIDSRYLKEEVGMVLQNNGADNYMENRMSTRPRGFFQESTDTSATATRLQTAPKYSLPPYMTSTNKGQTEGMRKLTKISSLPQNTVSSATQRHGIIGTEVSLTQRMPTSTPSQLAEGSRISHQRFGMGTVLCIEGNGENTKATVVFDELGEKQLLLKFAKFNIIG